MRIVKCRSLKLRNLCRVFGQAICLLPRWTGVSNLPDPLEANLNCAVVFACIALVLVGNGLYPEPVLVRVERQALTVRAFATALDPDALDVVSV